MTEKLFMGRIIQGARALGYLCYHTFNAYRSAKGFPDLTLVHPRTGKLFFIEVKTDTGKVTPEQEAWIAALQRAPGVRAAVVRPDDWDRLWEALK